MFKSGFVTIVGRPNVGKSTLLNALVGTKLAIVSDRPQTTRNRITGIMNAPGAQVVFIDTPGIHRHKGLLNEYMVKAAHAACEEVDLVVFMVEAGREPSADDGEILGFLKTTGTPLLLAVNKVDLVKRDALLPLITRYASMHEFAAIVPVSAETGENLEELKGAIVGRLHEGPMFYQEDELTDQPERNIAAELIREKIFRMTRHEVPYSTAVVVEEFKDKGEKTYIRAVIYVEKDSQKGIIIGAGGRMLKSIGQSARTEIERLLGISAYLELWVKVRKDWRESPGALHEMGYD